MARKRKQIDPARLIRRDDGKLVCPFTVVIDTREQNPYTFANIHANAEDGGGLIEVPTIRRTIATGDYQIDGLSRLTIERKSKSDLWGSIANRQNFVDRMVRFSTLHDQSFVVVEAEISELISNPPHHTNYSVKSILRTIQAWKIRYPTVHWEFLPGRNAAEAWTFRLMQAYHRHATYAGLTPSNPLPSDDPGGPSFA